MKDKLTYLIEEYNSISNGIGYIYDSFINNNVASFLTDYEEYSMKKGFLKEIKFMTPIKDIIKYENTYFNEFNNYYNSDNDLLGDIIKKDNDIYFDILEDEEIEKNKKTIIMKNAIIYHLINNKYIDNNIVGLDEEKMILETKSYEDKKYCILLSSNLFNENIKDSKIDFIYIASDSLEITD